MFEINLVPDLKTEILKTQKIRNIVFVACVLIMVGVGILVAIFASVNAYYDVTIDSQDKKLKLMSNTINNFEDLDEYLTLQNQLNNINEISLKRLDYARFFNLISVLAPKNGDEITFSGITINTVDNTIRLDAQADAKTDPDIDYRVLEAFKKSMEYMKFDYGVYKNKNGEVIPSVCIIEVDEKGNMLVDEDTDSLYAIWTKGVSGCDPDDEGHTKYDDDSGGKTTDKTEIAYIKEEDVEKARNDAKSVIIWRTPQLKKWYRGEGKDNYIDKDGNISNIEHFESECMTYKFVADRWTSENVCNLIVEPLNITSSSNGMMAGSLVLKFSATIKYNVESMLYKNKHMSFIAPSGYTNVTDSNLLVQNLFKEEAIDCDSDEIKCADAGGNSGEGR